MNHDDTTGTTDGARPTEHEVRDALLKEIDTRLGGLICACEGAGYSTLESVATNNHTVSVLLRAGRTAEDCVAFLACLNETLRERIRTLEALCPKRLALDDGTIRVWRCPEHLIPISPSSAPLREEGRRQ